jgi:peptidoglycan/LPS O-acetylase OafA/YrhL
MTLAIGISLQMKAIRQSNVLGGYTPQHDLSSIYRPDIDVLRAIAVLAVVAFHWDVKPFLGGFVGVDVFFVVSGFLITGIISRQMDAGTFSFIGFYERRIRRILPALYAMVLTVTAAAYFLLLPSQVAGFARSIVAVVIFGSNILFWQETGYFDGTALSKPLLHTWSLAVEEQFYLVFPVMLWLLWMIRPSSKTSARAATKLLILVAALSFGFGVWQLKVAPASAFFLAPGRAWEFLLGSILALGKVPRLPKRWNASVVAWLGLIMLFAAILGFRSGTAFPGAAALLPCVGTALCIWANTEREYGKLERAVMPLPLFFGKISYSLYLWHWPIWVLARSWLRSEGDFSTPNRLAMFAIVATVSSISYRFIEQPFRRAATVQTRRLFAYGALASAVLLLAGVCGVMRDGVSGQLTLRDAALAGYRMNVCFLEQSEEIKDFNVETCLKPKPGARNVLLLGDSLAAHYLPGLSKIGSEFGLNILQANASSCLPFPDIPQSTLPNCDALNRLAREQIQANPPDFILMSANWWAATQGLGYDRFQGALRQAINAAASIAPVILIGPSIQYVDPLPDLLAAPPSRGDISRPTKLLVSDVFVLDRKMSEDFSGLKNVSFISVIAAACPNEICPTTVNGVPMEWDAVHLTVPGSERLVDAIRPQLNKAFSNK